MFNRLCLVIMLFSSKVFRFKNRISVTTIICFVNYLYSVFFCKISNFVIEFPFPHACIPYVT